MVEYPDIVLNLILAIILYLGWTVIYKTIKHIYSKPNEVRLDEEYSDDEPDGSNYVTMPNGDRRLD